MPCLQGIRTISKVISSQLYPKLRQFVSNVSLTLFILAHWCLAGVYFEAGISLLSTNHWQEQYSLSLELYNSSVLVSFMIGNITAISTRLSDILAHAMSFDDAVDAHVLQAKYLASQAQYAEAFNGVLEILSAHLGESFPEDITESMIREEVNSVEPMLRDITKEKILCLPAMTNKQKLNAMRFMDLLASLSSFSSPMLHHLVSCRMTRLTFKVCMTE